jgi:hypothetical protein
MAGGAVVATGDAAVAGAATPLATPGAVAPEVVESVDGGGVDGAASGAAAVAGAEVEGVDGVVVVAVADGGEAGLVSAAGDGNVGAVGVVVDGGLGASLVAGGGVAAAGCALSCAAVTAMPASSEAIVSPASLETFENVGRR